MEGAGRRGVLMRVRGGACGCGWWWWWEGRRECRLERCVGGGPVTVVEMVEIAEGILPPVEGAFRARGEE